MQKKISLKIDHQRIQGIEGENLLKLARENGFNIPGLCYHDKLSPTGACRLCCVKIKNTKGLSMACSIKATEGMEVIAFDEEIEENRKQTLLHLLSEHNPSFNDTYYDEFRQFLIEYNIDTTKITIPRDELIQQPIIDQSSPALIYDASKCIKCFRCIKACSETQGKDVLNFTERGISSYIIAGTGIWGESECDGCGECIQRCPTGALVEKPHRDSIKLSKIDKKVKTTCPYCGVGCQLMLYIQDGRIVRSDGYENNSPNYGSLCVKGRFGYDFVHSKERLSTPLIKKNGVFRKASWEEALNLIAYKFNSIKEKYGNDALAGYSSAKCTNEDNYIFQKFIRLAFGSNNMDYCTRLCHASTVTAMIKAINSGAASNSIEDFEKTDCLFVTGNNIIETHPITANYVKRGAAKGMNIIVCDPKWTPLVKYAKIWLQPKSGTDVALLNGMIHIIIKENLIDIEFINNRIEKGMAAFEDLKAVTEKYTIELTMAITGVPKEKIIAAARMYATAKTAMIATGMGMSQQLTGTANVFALLNMCFITGKIGKDLCGINPPRGQNNVQGATDVGVSPFFHPGYISISDVENRKKIADIWKVDVDKIPIKPGLTTIEIVKAVHDEKIKALYIMGENPLVTDPNLNHTKSAFKKLEFLVVQDIFMTETALEADVVLPASSFAEKEGSFVNSDRRVLRVRKAVELPGDAREDWKILIEIAEKMGISIGKYQDAEAIFNEIASITPIMAGINYARLENEGIQWPCPDENHPGTPTLFLDSFGTPSGKANIFPVDYIEQNEKVSEKFPFMLNSGRILNQYHSATMSRKNEVLRQYGNESYVLMHPKDVDSFGFTNGQKIRLINSRGELTTTLKTSNEVNQGEVFMPWHFGESLVNNLTRDEMDDYSKIAPFKLSAVRIENIL